MKQEQQITVLCIDDDEDDQLLVCEAIRNHDQSIKVHCAKNGLEGLKILERLKVAGTTPNLIILDYNMPVMDGSVTLREIRSNTSWDSIPVVLYTTSTLGHTVQFAENFNAKMVTKGTSNTQVADQIKQMLEYAKIDI